MVEQSTSTQEQTAAASDSAWNTFTRTADKDLGALARRLDEIREGLAEFERMEVDRWAERVKRAREEIAKEVAEAPVKRQRDRDELRREIEEIRREVAALLAKVGIGKPPPMGDESQE